MSSCSGKHKLYRRAVGWAAITIATVCGLTIHERSQAQDATVNPRFTVASMKLNKAGINGCSECVTVGHALDGMNVQNFALITLIAQAWDVKREEISGPGWLETTRYDIAAKAEGRPTREQLKLMLRSLLVERLNLKTHLETKETQGWALLQAKSGPKLLPGTPDSLDFRLENGTFTFHNLTMKDFATRLPRFFHDLAGSPITDRTGLEGTYNIVLRLADNDQDAVAVLKEEGAVSSLLRDQLGLQLKAEKTSVTRLVVDHVDKLPQEN
jgi:uncharacterized protein (TIGR03435 family)